MGSSRGQLIGQFLSETFLITLLAVVISIALVPFILELFSDFISKDIKFDVLGHPVVLLCNLKKTQPNDYPDVYLKMYSMNLR